jgi:hypothetical protein
MRAVRQGQREGGVRTLLSLRRDDDFSRAPDGVGLHIHSYQVAINPQADEVYVSVEDPVLAGVYRLSRAGQVIERTPVLGGTIEYDAHDCAKVEAIWWSAEGLGEGAYCALTTDQHGRGQVVFFDIGHDANLWWVEDSGEDMIDGLFSDCPDSLDDPYPDEATIADVAEGVRAACRAAARLT